MAENGRDAVWQNFLLAECVEAFDDHDEEHRQRQPPLLNAAQFHDVRPIMIAIHEDGDNDDRRKQALLMLEAKFGPLSVETKRRVEALSRESLHQLLLDLVKARSLRDLRLED